MNVSRPWYERFAVGFDPLVGGFVGDLAGVNPAWPAGQGRRGRLCRLPSHRRAFVFISVTVPFPFARAVRVCTWGHWSVLSSSLSWPARRSPCPENPMGLGIFLVAFAIDGVNSYLTFPPGAGVICSTEWTAPAHRHLARHRHGRFSGTLFSPDSLAQQWQ